MRMMMSGLLAVAVMGCVMDVKQASAAAATEPATAPASTAPQVNETTAQRDARLKWWREARFGMFIHWGVYSVPAGTWQGKQIPGIGEWIMNNGKIPVADYAGFTKQFNPVKFDANKWVEIAQNAGVKYIVITAKHHDGFAMFHTAVDDYNIVDATPYKHDPLKDLAEAAASHGMKLGFYYSQSQDWHHPGGAALHGGHWDKAQDGDYDEYLKNVALPQVREILTNYGKVAELWFDTPVEMTPARAAPFLDLLALQPEMVFNNRLETGKKVGDFDTPEQYIPATGFPGKDWETCMTMNDTWGYKSYDDHWKSAAMLIQNLINAASKGGNYLLNVGPTSEGEIPEASVERLAAMGAWMKVNGEAIYGTTASPFRLQHWGRCTKKVEDGKTTLYLEVFDWPKNGELSLPVKNAVEKAYLLASPERVFTAKADADGRGGQILQVSGDAPDAVASVVVVQLTGSPEVVAQAVPLAEDGSLHLLAQDATLTDATFNDIANFGKVPARMAGWKEKGEAAWEGHLTPGTYKVMVNASTPEEAKFELAVSQDGGAATTVALDVPPTGAKTAKDYAFSSAAAGTIQVDKSGIVQLSLRSAEGAKNASIAEIVLTPVK
jgi:alpha-L-fucosidase